MNIEEELKEQENTYRLLVNATSECLGTIKFLKKKLELQNKDNDKKKK